MRSRSPNPFPFHLVPLAGEELDQGRRRVQNETSKPTRLPRPASSACSPTSASKSEFAAAHRLLAAGDPRRELATVWHAKEAAREDNAHPDAAVPLKWVDYLKTARRRLPAPVRPAPSNPS